MIYLLAVHFCKGSTRPMKVNRFSAFLALIFLAAGSLVSQEFRATINGQITDPSGSGVPGAKVTVKNLATNSRGGLIENQRVTELPLNGRNPFALTSLSTGVIFAGNPQFTRPFDNGDNVNFSINGGLRQTNSWLLDGVPDDSITDTDAQRTRGNQNIAYIPTVDATQEFKIVTNFYDAQYGRTGGGVINVATKTGANA